MSTIRARIKTQHAEKVLAALDKLRAWDWICDFTIQVGSETFPVHRTVLASCSEYFFDLFKRNGIEVQKGGIEIEGLGASTVKLCIEFMYTGVADITLENVDHILLAARNFKLADLTDLCLDFLTRNLCVQNCLYVRNLCEKYGYDEKRKDGEKFITENFNELVQTRGFLTLKKDDVLSYLASPNVDFESLWKAITYWVKFRADERKGYYFEFLSLNSAKFPPEFLLSTIWPERLTKESKPCRDLVVNLLLSDLEKLTAGITTDNCFILKDLCGTYYHPNSQEAHNQVRLFMMKSFEKIADRDEIVNLSKDEIFQIFRSPKTKYSSEVTKWEVALKWTRHHFPNRKKYFADLFAAMKLENLAINFIQDVIHTESLVQDSAKCKEILMHALFNHARKENSESSIESLPRKRTKKEAVSQATKLKTPDSKSEKPPKKMQKIMRSTPTTCTGTLSAESSTSFADVSSSDITYLAVFDSQSGKVKGLNLNEVKWKDLAVIKVTKDEFHGLTCVGNKLYLQQGNGILVLEKNGWMKLAPKPSKTNAEARILTFQNYIYIVQDGCLSTYDVDANKWEEHTPFILPGEGFCACSTDMYIYILGGSINPREARKYDPLSGAISAIEPLAEPRKGAACASLKNAVYIVGGAIDGIPSMTVEKYDEQADLWTVVSNMQVQRSNFCAFTFGEKIYAVGGRANITDKMDSVEVYEMQKDKYRWRILHRMLKLNAKITACVVKMPGA